MATEYPALHNRLDERQVELEAFYHQYTKKYGDDAYYETVILRHMLGMLHKEPGMVLPNGEDVRDVLMKASMESVGKVSFYAIQIMAKFGLAEAEAVVKGWKEANAAAENQKTERPPAPSNGGGKDPW